MAMKHKVTIQVKKRDGKPATVLRGASRRLPTRLLKLLFGDFTQVYLLAPGQTIVCPILSKITSRPSSWIAD